MSIETEFESTITNVQNAYQGLDNLGATIPQNKTIENIKNCLDEIYAKFPKTDYAEGSNITLSNTLKGKLDFEDGIVGIGDTSQKTTTGKNKLQFPYIETSKTDRGITYVVNNDGTITVSGTATDNSVITLLNLNSTEFSNIRNLLLNNDCILNGCPSGGSNTSYRLQLYGYTSGGVGALADYGSGVSLSYFANETNAFNVAIFIPTGTVISTPITFKPMIRLANVTDDTYEQYTGGQASPSSSYPQEIEVVRGTQTVYIKDENNNIIDTKTINLGEYEFAKIGNYVDTIEYDVENDKVYKNVNVGKQILNGDETITLSAISDNTVRIRYSYDLLPYTAKGDLLGLCNRLLAKNIWDIDEEGFFFYGKQLIMRINKETVGTTSTSINAWLENNNMIFNYALEEAVKQEITGTLKDQIKALYNSQSFTGTTIIKIGGQLPLIIKVRALKGE